ncbi:MAG: DUF1249 domain-containing protein [Gammaproteobacteria bacterium]|uniref:DUF1249 domain-containing protein n=1 Tax=Candidatus Thiopontia autotrophica TaxID=2841688 RepID=A0A8J6P8N4_9GAMM|nr:DUF1249 domain-containing protein [Candidatus Thiopontia autotrophica]
MHYEGTINRAISRARRGVATPAQAENIALLKKLVRHDLKSLMALYEENFDLFFRLVPDVRTRNFEKQFVAEGEFPLFLTVVEENKFTTTLLLTHRFVGLSGSEEEPSAKIRLYHDSQQAEVMSMSQGESLRSFLSLVRDGEENLDARWRLNLFLNHWLRHCIEQDYSF